MAVPDAPTATSIVTEAYARYGVKDPTSDQLSRGISEGLEQVKDTLCLKSRQWKTMRWTLCSTLAPNISIQTPYFDDFERMISIDVWEGLGAETLFDNDNSTIGQWVLSSSETRQASDFLGKYMVAYAQASDNEAFPTGNQICSLVQPLAYNPSTKVLQFVALTGGGLIVPTNSSAYRVLSNRWPITVRKYSEFSRDTMFPDIKGRPTQAYVWDYQASYDSVNTVYGVWEQMIQYDRTADQTYFTVWNYYIDLQRINLSEDRYSDMLLRRWKTVFIQGVYVWLLEDNSDDRLKTQATKFSQMLSALGGQDIDGHDVSDIQRVVED